MANIVNIWKVMDGPSHVTMHCFLKSDGAEGELTDYTIVNPVLDLVPKMAKRQDLILKKIWYELTGFTITLAFGSDVGSWPFWTLTPGASLHHDWRFFGGIRDHADAVLGMSANGKLLMSTTGFTDATDSGAFVLWLEKRDRVNPQPD